MIRLKPWETRLRWWEPVAQIAIVLIVASVIWCDWCGAAHEHADTVTAVDFARETCASVHLALVDDAADLADPARRDLARLRFGQAATYHSRAEIRGCAKLAHAALDLSSYQACWVAADYPCLVALAQQARDATARLVP